jgi:(p)ppGpp synthase/HD superfamily hydrolase
MHDSLEDVPLYTRDLLLEEFGRRVAEIVSHVTEPLNANKEAQDQLPWLTRKEAYLRILREGGRESAIVSAADKIHNIHSFLEGLEEEGESFIARFNSSFQNHLWFYEELLGIVKEKLGAESVLVSMLQEAIIDFKKKHRKERRCYILEQ